MREVREFLHSTGMERGGMIFLDLVKGRIIGFPADRFRILKAASEEELKKVTVEVNGFALRLEALDKDLTVEGIVAGRFQLPLPEVVE